MIVTLFLLNEMHVQDILNSCSSNIIIKPRKLKICLNYQNFETLIFIVNKVMIHNDIKSNVKVPEYKKKNVETNLRLTSKYEN